MTDGEFLKELQRERKLTQTQMAELLGLPRQQSFQYYAGLKVINGDKRKQFMQKLGLTKWSDEEEVENEKYLIQAIYARFIKLEHQITGKSVEDIMDEIENEKKILRKKGMKK